MKPAVFKGMLERSTSTIGFGAMALPLQPASEKRCFELILRGRAATDSRCGNQERQSVAAAGAARLPFERTIPTS